MVEAGAKDEKTAESCSVVAAAVHQCVRGLGLQYTTRTSRTTFIIRTHSHAQKQTQHIIREEHVKKHHYHRPCVYVIDVF